MVRSNNRFHDQTYVKNSQPDAGVQKHLHKTDSIAFAMRIATRNKNAENPNLCGFLISIHVADGSR